MIDTHFSLDRTIQILERTPGTLESFLSGLSDEWLTMNEGGETWSPFEVVGHLIHGERTDWMVRARIILSQDDQRDFAPFDRFAQKNFDPNENIDIRLQTFRELRTQNLNDLQAMNIDSHNLQRTGIHPEFGEVTLQQLLATWVVHDLGHIAQISRVMAHQYHDEAGPWKAYLRILNNP